MARGFESKSVADQQESLLAPRREPPQGDLRAAARLRGIELARIDVLRRLAAARTDAQRETLRRALEALDREA
jgi:hypothetical protein